MNINLKLLDFLNTYTIKPPIFESGEPRFWDDPYISKSMLDAHLDASHDLASRRPEAINRTVQHLFQSRVLQPGMKVLDLGCGPGLYAERLCRGGASVVGLDISSRSLEYARKRAIELGLEIEYNCMNFLDMDYLNEFDVVIQVYGELCVFSDEMRDKLLKLIHRSLKKDGLFVFDVTTRELRKKYGVNNEWYMSDGGFWRQGKHLVMQKGFDYPDEDVWLDQFIVVDEHEYKVYRNWFHDYSRDTINTVINSLGFKTKHMWNDLMGNTFVEGGDWIAIVAQKDC